MSVFNNKKHHHYLGLYLILVIILAVAVKADINYLLFKIKGKSQNSYEFTASLNSNSNKYAHDYTVNFPNTKFLIDFNGMLRNILHQKQMNNVTKLNNNYLTILNKQLTPKELDIRAERLAKLNEICKKNNIHFLFLQPSYDISKYDPQLPKGLYDYTNANIDGLLTRLQDKKIPFIDLREEMNNEGLNIYDYYFRTDHHWNVRGAFYAFSKIVKWISQKTNVPYDDFSTNLNNYNIELYKQWHMGSRAQRTGSIFAGLADDFELIVPNYPTRIFNTKNNQTEYFYESVIKKDTFNKKPGKTNRYTYDNAYCNNDINNLKSLDAKTPITVLFIGDSYSRAVTPFLLLTYKKTYFEWENYDISKLIQKYNPNVVIVETYPENLNKENIYDY